MQTSLYAEGNDNIRIMSTRFRTRAIAEDNREEVRKLEAEIKTLSNTVLDQESDLKALAANLASLTKLEGFTTATMLTLTDKGQLDSEKVIALATYIRENRTKYMKEEVRIKQLLATEQEKLNFLKRQLQEKAGGVSRTERDAVIVIDKKAGAGTVRLNYLVSNSTWRPQYKLRAGTKAAEPVTVEYLAAVSQQTGEDWNNVNVVLSTAQPQLNSSPPDIRALEISVGPTGGLKGSQPMPGVAVIDVEKDLKKLEDQSKSLRSQSSMNYNAKNPQAGGQFANEAAALEQFRDLLVSNEEVKQQQGQGGFNAGFVGDGPSVTYRLKSKLSLPSRSDEQTLEVAKIDMAPKFYYKAVPVLTQNVYRLADLTNTSEFILLPGEATMYRDSDFVGSTTIPLVAMGKPFTVGFGVDPQLQVHRKLMDKTRTTQGGNQVLTFKYRILVSSYKSTAVEVQVWDRMPHAEAMQTIAMSLTKGDNELSKDPLYVRDDRPKNLFRWDVKVDPKQNGEKALTLDYEFKMELDKNVTIGSFMTK
jgi:hypothetical protein